MPHWDVGLMFVCLLGMFLLFVVMFILRHLYKARRIPHQMLKRSEYSRRRREREAANLMDTCESNRSRNQQSQAPVSTSTAQRHANIQSNRMLYDFIINSRTGTGTDPSISINSRTRIGYDIRRVTQGRISYDPRITNMSSAEQNESNNYVHFNEYEMDRYNSNDENVINSRTKIGNDPQRAMARGRISYDPRITNRSTTDQNNLNSSLHLYENELHSFNINGENSGNTPFRVVHDHIEDNVHRACRCDDLNGADSNPHHRYHTNHQPPSYESETDSAIYLEIPAMRSTVHNETQTMILPPSYNERESTPPSYNESTLPVYNEREITLPVYTSGSINSPYVNVYIDNESVPQLDVRNVRPIPPSYNEVTHAQTSDNLVGNHLPRSHVTNNVSTPHSSTRNNLQAELDENLAEARMGTPPPTYTEAISGQY